MKALIVAAGYGSRLRTVSPSKPLTPVAGVPLIERIVAAGLEAGVKSFVVVTGHRGAAIESYVSQMSRRLHVRIACVRTDDWSLPNGHSVLTGADVLGPKRHLLMMADHLVDARLIRRVMKADPAPLVLGVDRRIDNPLVDLDDVTRVKTKRDRIVAIGKHLPDYDCFDTGVFAVDGRFHDALRAAGKRATISDGVQTLAAAGDARVVDVRDAWWLDVDDPRALALAEDAFAPAQLAAE